MYSRIIPGRLNRRSPPRGSSASVNFAALFPGAYQVVQTDLGLTYGGTLLDTGGAGPVITLTGTLNAGLTPVPIWVKCTLGGALGVWTFAVYYDGTGTTPAMTGTSSGVPIPLSGAGAGLTLNFAAGVATLNNIWKATCSALADQSGNGLHYSQANAAKQPVIGAGPNGKPELIFDAVDDTMSSTLVTASPFKLWMIFRAAVNGGGCAYCGESVLLYCLTGDPSAGVTQYAGSAFANSTAMGISTYTRVTASYTNSTSDSMLVGASAPTTGQNAGASTKLTNAIASNSGIQFAPIRLLALAWMPGGVSTAAADAALNTAGGYGPGAIVK